MAQRHCAICSKPVLGWLQKYCSRACARAGHNLRRRSCRQRCLRPRKCRACSTRFKPRRKGNVYCSNACRQADYRHSVRTRSLNDELEALLRLDVSRGAGIDIARTPARRRQLDAAARRIRDRKMADQAKRMGFDTRPPRRDGRATDADGGS